MRRCQTSSGSVVKREAPFGYARIHLVGQRPIAAIHSSTGRMQVPDE